MANLQLTAQIKSDSLDVLGYSGTVYTLDELVIKNIFETNLNSAGDTDNMSCTVEQLELLQSKIALYKSTLTGDDLDNVGGEYNDDGELVSDGLEQKVQAAIDAG